MEHSGDYQCYAKNLGQNGIEYRASDYTTVEIAKEVVVQIHPAR